MLEEAYTTEHWLVRIYKVGQQDQQGGVQLLKSHVHHLCVPQVKDLDNRGLSRT